MAALLNLTEVANVLGVSSKTAAREVSRGRLTAVSHERPATGGKLSPLFSRRDVEKLRDVRAATAIVPGQTDKGTTALSVRSGSASAPLIRAITEAMAVPLSDRLTLSTKEASRLSGVPVSVLVAARKAGTLPAVRLGRGYRLWPADLSRFVESLRPAGKRRQ